jgi:hypothetical protein
MCAAAIEKECFGGDGGTAAAPGAGFVVREVRMAWIAWIAERTLDRG